MTLYIDTKPTLEWVDSPYNNKAWADIYEIERTQTGRWLLMSTPGNNHYHQTLDEAKAAAQADYERRTAERFREVEVPNKIEYNRTIPPIVDLHNRGFNTAIVALQFAIAKAKEQP